MPSWKHKALLQRLFSAAPHGHRLNLLFQRHVTHGLPISTATLAEAVAMGLRHVMAVREVTGHVHPAGTFYEFGAGFDLHMPLILWSLGVDRQVLVDVRPLLQANLLFDIARRLGGDERAPAFVRTIPAPRSKQSAQGYLQELGIDYRAPADARSSGLPSGSIAVITSTNTLEHIPPEDIRSILEECRRVLTDDGLMSFGIDYQDHYSYFDRSLSPYNYLRYDDRTWQRYNSALHFQNRLRHRDYRLLIEDAGFIVVSEDLVHGSEDDLRELRKRPIDAQWSGIDLDEVAVRASHLVIRKTNGSR